MHKIVKEQLLKSKDVEYFDTENNKIDLNNLDNYKTIIIKQKIDTKFITKPIIDNSLYLFAFNNTNIVPLIKMQGYILEEKDNKYKLKLKGYYEKSNTCFHCNKSINSSCICLDCLIKFNVNDIEEIYWNGWIDKTDIINQLKLN